MSLVSKDNQKEVTLYKDFFIIYKDLIIEGLKEKEIPAEVLLINNDLINVNRAPLVVLKRTNSPQPPNVALLNEKSYAINSNNYVEGTSHNSINMAFICFGNTYMEAERISSQVFETLMTSSIIKIKEKSEGKVTGHNVLGWSESSLVSQDSKLFASRIDMSITILLKYAKKI